MITYAFFSAGGQDDIDAGLGSDLARPPPVDAASLGGRRDPGRRHSVPDPATPGRPGAPGQGEDGAPEQRRRRRRCPHGKQGDGLEVQHFLKPIIGNLLVPPKCKY